MRIKSGNKNERKCWGTKFKEKTKKRIKKPTFKRMSTKFNIKTK